MGQVTYTWHGRAMGPTGCESDGVGVGDVGEVPWWGHGARGIAAGATMTVGERGGEREPGMVGRGTWHLSSVARRGNAAGTGSASDDGAGSRAWGRWTYTVHGRGMGPTGCESDGVGVGDVGEVPWWGTGLEARVGWTSMTVGERGGEREPGMVGRGTWHQSAWLVGATQPGRDRHRMTVQGVRHGAGGRTRCTGEAWVRRDARATEWESETSVRCQCGARGSGHRGGRR